MKKSDLGSQITNEIIFYCDEINEHLKGVLNSMDIKVEIIPTSSGKNKYSDYYKNLTRKLNEKIKTAHNNCICQAGCSAPNIKTERCGD